MRNRIRPLLLVAALLACLTVAASTVVTVWSASSLASATSAVYGTGGASYARVQVCGTGDDGWSGTVYVDQGAAKTSLTVTKTLTIDELESCSQYHKLDITEWTRLRFARDEGSDGTLTVYLEYSR